MYCLEWPSILHLVTLRFILTCISHGTSTSPSINLTLILSKACWSIWDHTGYRVEKSVLMKFSIICGQDCFISFFYCVSAGSVVFVQSVESKSYCISHPQAVFRECLLDLSSLIGHFVTDIMSAHGLQPVVLRSCLYSLDQWKQHGFCFIRVSYNDCARCWLFVWIWDSSSRELCSIRAGSLKARSQLGQ